MEGLCLFHHVVKNRQCIQGGADMLRGAKKNMIVVRTRDSRVFEEAYFVIRPDTGTTAVDDADMLWEANRILENTTPSPCPSSRTSSARNSKGLWRGLLWYGLGILSGGGAVGFLWLLL